MCYYKLALNIIDLLKLYTEKCNKCSFDNIFFICDCKNAIKMN